MLRTILFLAGFALGARVGIAQDVASAQRPRFLASSSGPTRTVEIDPATAPVFQRRVTLTFERATVGEVLAEIGRQTGIHLVYSRDVIDLTAAVRVKVDGITVAAALTELLLGRGMDVVLSARNRVTLAPRRLPSLLGGGAVTGRVTDAKTGGGLAGAEVFLEKSRWRTATDSSGRYHLVEVDTGSYTLTVRRLGYVKRSRAVMVRDGQTDTVDLAMEPVAARLDELVSTATGQQRRRDIGNAITTIQADSVLKNAPIKNLTDLLENRVPGLTVQHTTGAPGDPSKLRLRGLGSALRSNDPVVIVDGVRMYATQSEARSGNLTNLAPGICLGVGICSAHPAGYEPSPAPSPLDQIDPNIIEKIEVFKGPSAATLYGADAANGVIVITTKRGKPGPTRWSASITHGRTASLGQYPAGYFRWGRDSLFSFGPRNQGIDNHAHDERSHYCTLLDFLCVQDSLVRFQALNDPAVTILGHGNSTALSLTASGGTAALTYSLTGSYGDETGILALPVYAIDQFRTAHNQAPPDWMQRPQQYRNWNVTSVVTARLGPTADVTLNAAIARSDQQRTSLENQLAGLAGAYVDTANNMYYVPSRFVPTEMAVTLDYGLYVPSSPLSDYSTKRTASTITLTTGLQGQWRPKSWFSANGQAGLNVVPRDDRLFLPAGIVSGYDSGTVVVATGRSLTSTFNLQGTYRKPLGRGFVFETHLGTNLTATTTSDLAISATGLIPGTSSVSDARKIGATQQGSNTSIYGWYIEPRVAGQRLALSTGLRLDGGSAYGVRLTRTGGGGGGFLKSLLSLPKLNGSWVISEEPWFPFTAVFSSLRLLGAYGQAQVQPGPADRLRLYTGTAGQPTSQLTLTTLGNTVLRPERSTEFEGGFEANLLDSRVSVELTAYRKLQVDALMAMQLPPSVNGGGTQLTNIGNIRNTGMELTLGVTPVRLPALTWNLHLQYTRNNNIVTKLGDGVAPNKTTGLVEGYPLYSHWARPIIGFTDQNGDGLLQPAEIQVGDSLVYTGRLYPAHQSSLFTNVALFGGAVGVTAGFAYDAGQTQVDQTLRRNFTLVRALVDPSAPFSEQAAVWATTRFTNPTDYGLMQEVSTFRFNELSVNYRAPARVARLFRAQQLGIAVQGRNLGLHSTYRGKDPNVNLWSPGEAIADGGQLPQPRLWQVRVDLQF